LQFLQPHQHPMFSRMLLFILISALIFGLTSADAVAENNDSIQITNIQPQIVDEYLTLSARCQNLFSRKAISTIQSGLPSLIKYEIKLLESDKFENLFSSDKSVLHLTLARTITYDIWNEQYVYKCEDTTAYFTKFELVRQLASELKQIRLLKLSQLEADTEYSVSVQVQIVPISAEQGAKIDNWLKSSNRKIGVLASDERSAGFGLNMEKLLSFFIGSKKRAHNISEWHRSKSFKINHQSGVLQL
jgi:hypothetical protein